MRYLISCFALLAATTLALTALAQPPEKDGKKGDDHRAEMRERMLKEFDANKDGKLDDEERAKARERVKEMRAKRAKKPAAAKKHDREARRGSQPPNPAEIFEKFDKDKDGKLTKDEFMALAKAVHERMEHAGGRGAPGGARFEGRRPPGPMYGHGHHGHGHDQRELADIRQHHRFYRDHFDGRPRRPDFDRQTFDRFAGRPERGGFERQRSWHVPEGRRFERERFARGPESLRFERDRFAGRRGREFERERFAGPHGREFERDRFAGPPDYRRHDRDRDGRRPEQWGRHRDRFAGPLEPRDFDGPRQHHPPRPPFDGRFADRRFDRPPRHGDFGPRDDDRQEMGASPRHRDRDRDADRERGHRQWRHDDRDDGPRDHADEGPRHMRREGPPRHEGPPHPPGPGADRPHPPNPPEGAHKEKSDKPKAI